ncbi:MAG: NAD(P)-dependent alcohol dehydrogenase [Candidatus Thorarchaeota archaeon]
MPTMADHSTDASVFLFSPSFLLDCQIGFYRPSIRQVDASTSNLSTKESLWIFIPIFYLAYVKNGGANTALIPTDHVYGEIVRQMEDAGKMKAAICPKYGPPEILELAELETPQPNNNEVLIRNYGSSINTIDVSTRGGKAPQAIFGGARQLIGLLLRFSYGGLRRPKQRILGCGFAGKIEKLGKDVEDWQVGDTVYGYYEAACAEYLTVPADKLAQKPVNLSFHEASAVPGGASPALAAFRDVARPEKGQKVLIIGASGGIGTFGVQIAKHVYGAEVTAVCGPTNLDMVKSIGADFAIDYTQEDYSKNGQQYDIIFDAIGANTLSKCKNILTDEGVYVTNNPMTSPRTLLNLMTNPFRKKKLKSCMADESAEALELLRDWIEAGKVMPVIDTVYSLSQTAEAHRHYETGHAKGRIVISIE